MKVFFDTLFEKRYVRLMSLLFSGILTGLTLVFSEIGFLEWVTLVPAGIPLLKIASDRRYRMKHLYGYGVFFFTVFGCTIFHWFVNLYPLEFIPEMSNGAAIAVVLSGCIGLSLFQAVFGGLLFVLAGLLFRTELVERFRLLRPFIIAGLWAIYEWTQTLGWIGVPWGRLAIGQTHYIVGAQTASLFGSYFVTFVLVLVNMLVAYILLYGDRVKTVTCIGIGALAFQYGVGALLYVTYEESDRTITVAAIQGNVSSSEKWDEESADRTYETYARLTLEAAEAGAEIVVFPETAFPYTIKKGTDTYYYTSELARISGVTILSGGFTRGENNEEFNSIVCFTPDGKMCETIYSKRHLVPFGEYVPMRALVTALIPPLSELSMTADDLSAGSGTEIFRLGEGNIGSLICFDSIYEALAIDSVKDGAELICLSTNDSWFTDSRALNMHNAQAKLRAIENDRYMLRSANTGISCIISPTGEILETIAPLTDGFVIGEVELRDTRTLYSIIGNSFIYILIAIAVCIFTFEAVKNSLKGKNNLLTKHKRNVII